jgi:predicted transport protein
MKQLFYQALKERILTIGDNIEIRPKKLYITFVAGTNFVDILPRKSGLKLWVNLPKGELVDPEKRARDISGIGQLGNGDYQVIIENSEAFAFYRNLEYLMHLIKQSYTRNS